MKRLVSIIIIVTLPLIVFFQFMKYRRFHPPVNYEYVASDSIDVHYHKSEEVEEYYAKIVESSAYARSKWRNESIDVRFPDEDSETELNVAKYYNNLLSRIKYLEARLIASYLLKTEGFSNDEILEIESGTPKAIVKLLQGDRSILNTTIGDTGQNVWRLQQRLITKGYAHDLDGVFGIDTRNALASFQQDNGLFPSSIADLETLTLLFGN